MRLISRLKKFEKNKFILAVLPYFFIAFAAYPAIASIIVPGFFAMHDDLQAMRQLQMDKCWRDFQLPCRWVPDMGYGFGFPLFNYYPPFPYYLGELFHLLGFSFIDTVKVLFVLAFLISGFTMYFFAKEFFGKVAGVISAVFYIYAPYHALDVYVRGAMNEAWAITWFPVILWAIYKLIKTGKFIFVILLAIFSAFLALSHMITLMIFLPGAVLWAILWFLKTGNFTNFYKLILAGILGFGLSAFFVIPLISEFALAHTETLTIGYFNYLAHFLNLNQLFIARYWGYGESVLGPADTISLSVGHLHWIGTIVALAIALIFRKKYPQIFLITFFFFLWAYGYTFLAHQRAAPIWEFIKPLSWLQFPWRFLALTMIGTSFLSGTLILPFFNLARFIKLGIAGSLIVGVVLLNYSFFTWREFYPKMTDSEKFSGKLWQLQTTAGIFDYLPKQLRLPPADPPDGDAKFIAGSGNFTKIKKVSNLQIYNVKVDSNSASFQINTFYFPGWRAFVDSKEVLLNPTKDKLNGTMIIDLTKGEYKIVARFGETQVRLISDIISAVSWLILLGFVIQFGFQRLNFLKTEK